MIRAAALLALMAAPVSAQEADPAQQMLEGFSICMMSAKETAVSYVDIYKWTKSAAEDGIEIAMPGVGSDTFVLLSQDKSFCHVESLVLGTDKTLETFKSAIELGGMFKLPEPQTSPDGCALYDFGDGMTATLTSGGNDPTCTSQTDSALRFDFAAEQ